MRVIFQLLILPLPWVVRRWLLQLVPGFRIAASARIGWSLIGARELSLGERARIGHLTVVKGLNRLVMGSNARLGNLNWVTAVPSTASAFFRHLPDRDPSLQIDEHAAITHRHLIDCSGSVTIGAFATFAGWRSQIISHSFDFRMARQDAQAVRVGRYGFVGSGCVLLKGSVLPDRCILGAGSVLETTDGEPLGLYRGNPAERVGELPEDLQYFHRNTGFIA